MNIRLKYETIKCQQTVENKGKALQTLCLQGFVLCQPAAEKMPDGKMQKDSNRCGICQRSLSTLLTVQYNSDYMVLRVIQVVLLF